VPSPGTCAHHDLIQFLVRLHGKALAGCGGARRVRQNPSLSWAKQLAALTSAVAKFVYQVHRQC
jgi:hypothetical protein